MQNKKFVISQDGLKTLDDFAHKRQQVAGL